jgi:hypothetical protein
MSHKILTLQQFIDEKTSVELEDFSLPLCHTTSERTLAKILDSNALESTKPCEIFKEDLIFFFYGKAQYMPRKDDVDEVRPYSPTTFLFKINAIEANPKRMLPFDSGGFELYELPSDIKDFEISSPTEYTCTTYINKVFGSKNQYFIPEVIINPDVSHPLLYPLIDIKRMFEFYKNGKEKLSHRAFTLEIQYNHIKESKMIFNPFKVFLHYKKYTALKDLNQLETYFPGMEVEAYGDGTETDIGDKYRVMRRAVKDYITNNF